MPANAARDAAFMAPGRSAGAAATNSETAVSIEPKADVDAGETPVNVGRRATFFFVNQTTTPVEIDSIAANGDSNVKAEIVGDDCSKERKIPVSSRCSVTIETTPLAAGSWTAELLMTHKSVGRIARARVTGKTNASSAEKREMGLALSTKDIKPVDFGDVEVGTGKAVRTALMVNDSNEIISLLSIEVIAPENGLQRLEQGCATDMDLKMGESCPITMVWKPEYKGNVSTDLIIRHSGKLGFAVIPVRGTAKETIVKNADGTTSTSAGKASVGPSSDTEAPVRSRKVPMSPTADEMDKLITEGGIPALTDDDLPRAARGAHKTESKNESASSFHLIGTIGNRALIYKSDGSTVVIANGEESPVGDGDVLKVVTVAPKEAVILYKGKKQTLKLEAVSALTERAAQRNLENRQDASPAPKKALNGKETSTQLEQAGNKLFPKGDSKSVPLPMGR